MHISYAYAVSIGWHWLSMMPQWGLWRPAVLAPLSQEAHLVGHGVLRHHCGIISVTSFLSVETVLGHCRYCWHCLIALAWLRFRLLFLQFLGNLCRSTVHLARRCTALPDWLETGKCLPFALIILIIFRYSCIEKQGGVQCAVHKCVRTSQNIPKVKPTGTNVSWTAKHLAGFDEASSSVPEVWTASCCKKTWNYMELQVGNGGNITDIAWKSRGGSLKVIRCGYISMISISMIYDLMI